MDFDVIVGSEEHCQPHIMDPREGVRKEVRFRTLVADKTGLATAQVTDLSERGCRICLTKPLVCRQYLTLKVYSDDGAAALQVDLAMVKWTEDQMAGVEFLSLSQKNLARLSRLCGD